MAENVLVDLECGVAHWFDFETVHESSRPIANRRADDLRALLVTCLVRTVPAKVAETLALILDVYADEGVTRVLATSFTSVLRRSLSFHLAQWGVLSGFPGNRPVAQRAPLVHRYQHLVKPWTPPPDGMIADVARIVRSRRARRARAALSSLIVPTRSSLLLKRFARALDLSGTGS